MEITEKHKYKTITIDTSQSKSIKVDALIERTKALAAAARARAAEQAAQREAKRQEMRERFPDVAALVDEYRAAFGNGVKVDKLTVRDEKGKGQK